jgi:riboflavin kinase
MRLGATKVAIKISTTLLSKEIGGSQQSASRHLQLLEAEGMIERRITSDGSQIKITGDGQIELDQVLNELKWHLEGMEVQTIEFEGEVISGLFEGAYYISKEGYQRQIVEKLGFKPFPGTLNIRIGEDDSHKRRRLERRDYIRLEGFLDGERSFGAAHCFPCMINNEIKGALIVAERSLHGHGVMEIISPYYLRRKLKLVDGDIIKVSFVPLRRSDA